MYRFIYAFEIGSVRELLFEADNLVSALDAAINYIISIYGQQSLSQLLLFSVFSELLVGEKSIEH